jgi:hypothetical protein
MATADRRRAGSSLGLVVVLALAAICAVILVAAPTAIAAGSAVCDQYPDLPQCQATGATGGGSASVGGGGGDDVEGAGAGVVGGSASGDGSIPGSGDGATGSASKAGELPFTGYPLTPLVLLLLILLGAGISARAYIAARDRLTIRAPRHGS